MHFLLDLNCQEHLLKSDSMNDDLYNLFYILFLLFDIISYLIILN